MVAKTSSVYFCFIFCIMNDTVKVHGSMKCCFAVLKNHSVAYQLSESPGASCITTWSAMDVVLVDENGDVDQTVVHHESQKLIVNKEVKQVTYHLDCHLSRISWKVECENACAVEDVPNMNEATHNCSFAASSKATIIIIIVVIGIVVIIIIAIAISCKRHGCSASSSNFRAV